MAPSMCSLYIKETILGEKQQFKQLLYDIERILKGETKRHFIGTIVYIIADTVFMVREREVVDGKKLRY